MVTRRSRPFTRRAVRPARYIITDRPPLLGSRVDRIAYDILASRYGIVEQDFSDQEAEELLAQHGLRLQAQFVFQELLDLGSLVRA